MDFGVTHSFEIPLGCFQQAIPVAWEFGRIVNEKSWTFPDFFVSLHVWLGVGLGCLGSLRCWQCHPFAERRFAESDKEGSAENLQGSQFCRALSMMTEVVFFNIFLKFLGFVLLNGSCGTHLVVFEGGGSR